MVRRLALVAALVALAACGREPGFEDRTARVTIDGRTTTFTVDGCLRDGRTAYVVGRAEDGSTVQAVVGLEEDLATGVPASTGISVAGRGDTPSVAAFGPEAWARRGEEGAPPGTIASARVKGSRIQATGEAPTVDADDRPDGEATLSLGFDARCDEER